jgi:hypothetical protein
MRLIEVRPSQGVEGPIVVETGDLVLLRASGTRLETGEGVIEVLGSFRTAVAGRDGAVLTPAGPPDAVVLRAVAPGHASAAVSTGDPFRNPGSRPLEFEVRTRPA